MYKHILVPTDGSPQSEVAIRGALRLAKTLGAKVTGYFARADYPISAFSDYPAVGLYSPEEFYALQEDLAAKGLASLKSQAQAAGMEVQTDSSVALYIYRGIIQSAQSHGCDLIVMASHGRKGVSRMVLGSETNKVLTHSDIPVLVYRGTGGGEPGGESSFRHVLVPSDGAPPSRQAIKHAVALAKALAARVTGFYAAAEPFMMIYGEGMSIPAGHLESFRGREKIRAREILSEIEVAAGEAGVPCATEFVFDPDPAAAIIAAARRHQCDLISMASHGRRGFEALLLGSETIKVLTGAETPVLVLR